MASSRRQPENYGEESGIRKQLEGLRLLVVMKAHRGKRHCRERPKRPEIWGIHRSVAPTTELSAVGLVKVFGPRKGLELKQCTIAVFVL